MSTRSDALREALSKASTAELGGTRFVKLLELPSGAALGLDAEGGWLLAPPEGDAVAWRAGVAIKFCEVLEVNRRDFESQIEDGARTHGLPVDEVVLSFPAVALIDEICSIKVPPLITRSALVWALPSELRDIQPAIKRVREDKYAPRSLRDVANHLYMPPDPAGT